MHGKLKIDDFWAFIALDQDGTEGLLGFSSGNMMIPCVAADRARIESLRPIVKSIAKIQGAKKVTLCRFHSREDQEVLYENK